MPGWGRRTRSRTIAGRLRVLQADDVEPPGEVLDLGLEVLHVGAGDVLADELGEVPLAGDERDDRHGAFGHPRLDELDELAHLRC